LSRHHWQGGAAATGELEEDGPQDENKPNDEQKSTDDKARRAGTEAIQAEPRVQCGGKNQKDTRKEYQEDSTGGKQGEEAGAFAVFLFGPF
jgi:hypothetical protein